MSTSIAILKILSSYPEGRASYAALKSDLAMLSTREWLGRMRALGARGGPVNIFRDKLATRDGFGWTITAAGRALLDRLESAETAPARPVDQRTQLRVVTSAGQGSPIVQPRPPDLKLVGS